MLLSEMINLTGKLAIVTGGTGYLGTEISKSLLELGADVISIQRNRSKSFVTTSHDRFFSIEGDLSTQEGIDNALKRAYEFGDPDILVNNAYTWPQDVNFDTLTWGGISSTIESGLVSPLYLTRDVFNRMIASNKKGSIIFISSMYGHVSPDFSMYAPGMGNAISYGASKGGVLQVMRYIASLGGKAGVRSNSISPGPFPRPGVLEGKEWFEQELKDRTMLYRVGRADELKGAVAFLASDMSSYVTGTDIAVDGGWRAW